MRTTRTGCDCASEQHYVYRWDELNRLAEARRYDRSSATSGVWDLQVRQRYRYDGANQRTIKQTLDESGGANPERIALYVYPGDFERRGLTRGTLAYDADETLNTETQYVIAGARTIWRHDVDHDRDRRMTVPVSDLIQTTAATVDLRTGALLESSTYYPNGARETYQVDSGTAAAPEVNGFTGKEGDEEVGLAYFGERYLVPRVGRWATPDPAHVHALGGGESLNSFHYVAGTLLSARDPLGFELWAASFRWVERAGVNAGRQGHFEEERVRGDRAEQVRDLLRDGVRNYNEALAADAERRGNPQLAAWIRERSRVEVAAIDVNRGTGQIVVRDAYARADGTSGSHLGSAAYRAMLAAHESDEHVDIGYGFIPSEGDQSPGATRGWTRHDEGGNGRNVIINTDPAGPNPSRSSLRARQAETVDHEIILHVTGQGGHAHRAHGGDGDADNGTDALAHGLTTLMLGPSADSSGHEGGRSVSPWTMEFLGPEGSGALGVPGQADADGHVTELPELPSSTASQ